MRYRQTTTDDRRHMFFKTQCIVSEWYVMVASAMVSLTRISYRLSIVTMSLSLTVWPQF